MASKALLFLLATLLQLASEVSSNEKEKRIEMKYVKVPEPATPIPVKAPPHPAPAPPVKSPSPPYKPPTPAPAPPTTTPPYKPPSPPLPPVKTRKDCIPLCGERCKLHSRTNLCMRACITCCDRCKCVPPGTYGNREMCGKCYTDMKTHNNKPKCP
ncbi:Gibberellin-regulated protein 9 [Hibiscus syriacus]|uniref:Gibberellin-regulated protein 9 n=1 Tax=Hibiscus syriacus TaxID=106335 RepID=A0A6A2X236_HIBSY|nr:gibberellin-regulated protein 14-like [Hibiscus syriacus]KAE8668608.1 Gibberellin-regulated protein 9 [Hibiscus syriacus]